MEGAGAATVIADAELEPRLLLAAVNALLADEGRLAAMAAASKALAMPDAARRIADEVLSAADERGSSERDRR
jgi:UDP-N-acetylglucosamine--N-acetylmuramyl-(pentapeptide) pyrophosphoryl-undecaprenol N-acetylglucosamine transferase